jgi:hypothetical protein
VKQLVRIAHVRDLDGEYVSRADPLLPLEQQWRFKCRFDPCACACTGLLQCSGIDVVDEQQHVDVTDAWHRFIARH